MVETMGAVVIEAAWARDIPVPSIDHGSMTLGLGYAGLGATTYEHSGAFGAIGG
jgi:hypothetical protein